MERFWSKVDKRGADECWSWLGWKDRNGYGYSTLHRKRVFAHRLAFFLANGVWPEPSCLHRCDAPDCVNPRHLFAGTQADNMADMWGKGRGPRGETSGNCKLTDQQVMDIRANYLLCRVSQRELARRFNIGQAQVSRIVNHLRRAQP